MALALCIWVGGKLWGVHDLVHMGKDVDRGRWFAKVMRDLKRIHGCKYGDGKVLQNTFAKYSRRIVARMTQEERSLTEYPSWLRDAYLLNVWNGTL